MPDTAPNIDKAPASAAAFLDRRRADYTIRLPHSGLDVRVREIDVMDLVAAGDIPDTLSHHVYEEFPVLTVGKNPREIQELLTERHRIVGLVCCAMLVDPPMTMPDNADPGTISPTDLPWPDREFLWAVACGTGRLADLARFRDEQARAVAAAPVGEGVRAAAVDPAGPAA